MIDFARKNLNLSLYSFSIYVLVFSLGLLGGKLLTEPTIIKYTILREQGYKYINPVLLCNTNNSQKYNEDTELSKKIQNYIKNYPENTISTYFLSLKSGNWSSVNETETYSPASMMKVPTMVETLKYEENNHGTLSKKIYYDGSFDNNKMEDIKPVKYITPGKYYTIDELLNYMIVYSDNNALQLIHNTIKADSFQELYRDLHIEIPENTLDFMSVKTYSLFLRVLYNSTYLTRESSEKTLKLMSDKNSFPQGIHAGVPSNVEVADKFGERKILNTNYELQSKELHDCGIIYKENNPYILCVMTKGKDFESLTKNIADISKIVYDTVSSE